MQLIPLLKPSYTRAESDAVTEVLKSGWWGTGKVVEQFEQELARMYGYNYCVTTNSATAALHLTMMVLNIGPGDEVIVPSLTFVSTGLAPLYVGATPVLADVDKETLCIDWNNVKELITPKTKAIIPVDYAGYDADLSRKFRTDIPIVQDAAHSCGGVGYGDFVCLSFHPVKNLATGDGGAILTNNEAYYNRLKALRWCGIDRSTWDRTKTRYGWDYNIQELGYKYHWNDIQAAIGLAQLHRLAELNSARKSVADYYCDQLESIDEIQRPSRIGGHMWHLYPIRINADIRNEFINRMLENNISAGVHYKPLSTYPMFTGVTPVADTEWQRLVSLPIFYDITEDELQYIVNTVIDIITDLT